MGVTVRAAYREPCIVSRIVTATAQFTGPERLTLHPEPLPRDPYYTPQDPSSGVPVKERCVLVGLTSGGASTGYITLSMRVTMRSVFI